MIVYKKYEEISTEENICVSELPGRKEYLAHRHEFIEIIYTKAGTAVHTVDGQEYEASKGDLLIIDYGQIHSFVPDENYVYVNILLNPEFLSSDLIDIESVIQLFMYDMFAEFSGIKNMNRQYIHFTGEEQKDVERLVDTMVKEYNNKNIGYRTVLKGCTQMLISWILREYNFKEDKNTLREIMEYIDNNLSEKLELSELAAKSFYNPSYFSRLIKEKCGKSFTAYIKEKRISNAAEMLKNTNCKIDEIMRKVGYRDAKIFYKHFNEIYGVAPGAYRKRN